jgi:hypothetical protein
MPVILATQEAETRKIMAQTRTMLLQARKHWKWPVTPEAKTEARDRSHSQSQMELIWTTP